MTLLKDDNNADGGNKGGKTPRSNKGDIGSSGVASKPTNQVVRTRDGGSTCERGRAIIQFKELTTVTTTTKLEKKTLIVTYADDT